ncbi:MAG: tetratricopeptide repeat protein [Planctomycetes bacterium]|nr:tetratricopeptide repeat protein [Planctomycetota bacterium]
MDRASRISSLSVGALVVFSMSAAATAATPAVPGGGQFSSFRGGFGGAPRMTSFAPRGGGFITPGTANFGTTGAFRTTPTYAPGQQFNQWTVRNGFVPGTLPAMNSNTLPAMNSNTLPVLNQPNYPSVWPGGVPGVPPGTIPNPPAPPSVPCPPQPCPIPPVVCPPGWNWWPWGWNSWVAWNGANYVVYWNGFPVPPYVPGPFGGLTYLYDPNLLPGATQRSMAEQQSVAPAPAPTNYDLGVMAFRSRQSDAAVKYLTAAVSKDKEDTSAMRVLALAMLDTRQPDDAAAMLRQAYRQDPTLANDALDVEFLGLNGARRSDLINRAVEYANRVGSASSWLMVSVLMQADGRFELARRMLKRAADEGLEPAVFGAMDAALASRMRLPRQNP